MLERHNHRRLIFGFLFSVLVTVVDVDAFSPVLKSSAPSVINSLSDLTTKRRRRNSDVNRNSIRNSPTATTSSTSLNSLLEVPPYFFTFTFPMLGILLTVSKEFARRRLEESAWEQRLEEAREKRLLDDPTLTELDLRRKEAGLEWSAYGKPRRQEEEREKAMREEDDEGSYRSSSRRRVKVMEKDEDYDDDYDDDVENRKNVMSDNEINQFEMEYGVEYDPYYDDPYSEEELPDEPFNLDRKYGDRRYKNGEIFYKDKESGLFYRQGAKPRNLSLWKQ
ncbi:MAG: hypothetical protein ACI8RD_000428 [Bacillariaceae sp.]|jgi:hypothetical protein